MLEFSNDRDIVISKRIKDEQYLTNLLNWQNKARVFAFMFYYGRHIRNIDIRSNYYNFINELDVNSEFNYTMPQNVLYKHELNYLREYGSIKSIDSFIDYIDQSTNNQNLSEFLQIIYLSELITSPTYWKRHKSIFNKLAFTYALKQQQNNPYYHVLSSTSDNYFNSTKGNKAFDFKAINLVGDTIRLSDLLGKLVYIDNWATWCGPCINERPEINDMIKSLKKNDSLEIIKVSVDRDKENWFNFIETDENTSKHDYRIIDADMDTYVDKYNLSFLPKHVLINCDGYILDSNFDGPSEKTKESLIKYVEKCNGS